jgi:hypothetical protein
VILVLQEIRNPADKTWLNQMLAETRVTLIVDVTDLPIPFRAQFARNGYAKKDRGEEIGDICCPQIPAVVAEMFPHH